VILSLKQTKAQSVFRSFVDREIVPQAAEHDRLEHTPQELIQALGRRKYLSAPVPETAGGGGMDMITFGLLCEEIGRGSASLLSLVTVHGMVCQALMKWGTPEQVAAWLPGLAAGELIGAFGLTEPLTGSDAASVQTSAKADGNHYVLSGRKKWISFGQVADIFLILAACEGKPTVFLLDRRTPGLSITPLTGLLGFRAAMLAELTLQDCRVPAANLLGRLGFGVSHVVSGALDYGRYCVACGCTGLAQACLEASVAYANQREQFGVFLREHQLIQRMIADMITEIQASRLLWMHAGGLKEQGDPDTIMETSLAKYFASRMVNRVAADAVQIHGASGCGPDYPVQRYYRDAKIMEIIEGSTQIQQMIISTYGIWSLRRAAQKRQKEDG